MTHTHTHIWVSRDMFKDLQNQMHCPYPPIFIQSFTFQILWPDIRNTNSVLSDKAPMFDHRDIPLYPIKTSTFDQGHINRTLMRKRREMYQVFLGDWPDVMWVTQMECSIFMVTGQLIGENTLLHMCVKALSLRQTCE